MVIALVLAAVLSGPATDESIVELNVGTQKLVKVSSVAWMGAGDPGVADVSAVSPDQVLILGKAQGSTRVVIGRRGGRAVSYRVKVRSGNIVDGVSNLAQLMGWSFQEFYDRAELVGSRIIVRGQLKSLDELQRLAYLRAMAPNLIVLGHIDPEVVEAAVREANLELAKRGYSAHAIVSAGQLFIEGNVEDDADALKVEAIVAPVRELLEADRAARGEES